MTDDSTALTEAIATAGGPVAVARSLSELGRRITSQAVGQWKRVPADRVLHLEQVTGISRHVLRPDLYPEDKRTNA